ncbi:MAG: haloacid dehalogenase type II [Opitutales bacterium]
MTTKKTTIAFDVYGTLLDLAGMEEWLKEDFGQAAGAAAALWREKQVEYAFRRGLMRNYVDFSVCTADALRHVYERHGISIEEERRAEIIKRFAWLPAFPDVEPALEKFSSEFHLFAFSNGTRQTVNEVLDHAGLLHFFTGVLSVDEVRSFKPDPAVYAYARRSANAWGDPFWLVSSNAWDVIGARSAGLHSAWIRRSALNCWDSWEIEPDLVADSLTELQGLLSKTDSAANCGDSLPLDRSERSDPSDNP